MAARFYHRYCSSGINTASLLNKCLLSICYGWLTQMTKVRKGHRAPDLLELRIWWTGQVAPTTNKHTIANCDKCYEGKIEGVPRAKRGTQSDQEDLEPGSEGWTSCHSDCGTSLCDRSGTRSVTLFRSRRKARSMEGKAGREDKAGESSKASLSATRGIQRLRSLSSEEGEATKLKTGSQICNWNLQFQHPHSSLSKYHLWTPHLTSDALPLLSWLEGISNMRVLVTIYHCGSVSNFYVIIPWTPGFPKTATTHMPTCSRYNIPWLSGGICVPPFWTWVDSCHCLGRKKTVEVKPCDFWS